MELINEFSVAVPVSEAWPLLTDIERIAPCVPGCQLQGTTDDGDFRATMKVKVGAMQSTYDCVIKFVELDEEQHRAVIAAKGRETRGQGGVTASITSSLVPEGQGTRAKVVTDLDVTGKVAQFGRGILSDVSDRLVKQFVKQLETQLLAPGADGPARASAADEASRAGAGAAPPPPGPEPLDLLSVAGTPLLKRMAPLLGLLGLLWLVVRRR